MIDRDETYTDEILLHRPPEKPKKPKKSKHKHIYEPCVFESQSMKFDEQHGFINDPKLCIGSYCPLCGKVGSHKLYDDDRWYEEILRPERSFRCYGKKPTEEALREFDPETRTLPFFKLTDYWQKEVEL